MEPFDLLDEGTCCDPASATAAAAATGYVKFVSDLTHAVSLSSTDRALIDPEYRDVWGVSEHDFGSHEGRQVWNYHFASRSLEVRNAALLGRDALLTPVQNFAQASVWKGVRQVLDDTGRGNWRSTHAMLGVALGGDVQDKSRSLPRDEPQAIRDDTAWRQGRAFMLTVLFGPAPTGHSGSQEVQPSSAPAAVSPQSPMGGSSNLRGGII